MMKRLIGAALAAILLAGSASAAAPTAEGETLRFVNAVWWDGKAFRKGDRYVRDGQFVAPVRNARTVDLAGGWVVPPFGEAHNHNLDFPTMVRGVSDQYLANGVFYVKNPNSRYAFTPQARPLLNRQDTVDAVFSMGGITAEGGHPIRLYGFLSRFSGPPQPGEGFEGDAFHLVRTEADIDPVLDRLKGQGAEFIKTYLLHSEQYETRRNDAKFYGLKGLDPALYPRVVAAAHRRGLKVSVHIETAADFRTAVAAGVDEINHLPGYVWEAGETAEVYRLSEADARAAARAGVVVVTTTVVTEGMPLKPERKAEIQALQVANLKTLHAAGVRLAIGSDNYMVTSRAEAEHLIRLGAFDGPTVLGLWIDTAPTAIFPGRRIGCLVVGCEADFLVLGGDPLKDFAATGRITGAWKDGAPLTLVPRQPTVMPGAPGGGGHVH